MQSIFKIILYFFIFTVFSIIAQSEVKTRITLKDGENRTFNKLVFGIHEQATIGVDESLGENYDLPGPPPDGLWSAFFITDPNTQERTYSYLDLRPYPVSRTDTIIHEFTVSFSVPKLKLEWAKINDQIESAIITDYYGAGVIIDMKNINQYEVENTFIKKFLIKVCYKAGDYVYDNLEHNPNVIITNNPVYDDLFINISESDFQVFLISINGMEIEKYYNKKHINVSFLSTGIYFIKIVSGSERNFRVLKFIKM